MGFYIIEPVGHRVNTQSEYNELDEQEVRELLEINNVELDYNESIISQRSDVNKD